MVLRSMESVTLILEGVEGKFQFKHPYGIAELRRQHEANQVLVSDSTNHCIRVYDINGTYVRQFGEEGKEQGQFLQPKQVCVDREAKHIYVADKMNNRVQVFDLDFNPKHVIGEEILVEPRAVTTTRTHVVAADYENKIHVFDKKNHQYNYPFCSNGKGRDQTKVVLGMCYDFLRDRLIIGDKYNHRVSIWGSDFKFIKTINIKVEVYAVCSFADLLLVGTGSNIHVFDCRKDDTFVKIIGDTGSGKGKYYTVQGIMVDQNRRTWVVDKMNKRVQCY